MTKQPKNHHYVPIFHLSMFTASVTRDGELWILDKKQRKQWKSSPANTAKANNYNTVKELSHDPMAVETALSKVETKCAPVVRDVVANSCLPSGADFQILMNFVAIAVVRVPNVRAQFGSVVDKLMKLAVLPAFLGQEGAALLRYLAGIDGQTISDEEIQDLQAFVESEQFVVDQSQTGHLQTMVALFDRILLVLAQRNWAVWIADDAAGDFVCSDQPVALWDLQWPPAMPPHFAQPNTLLTFPLSRRVMLVSRIEDLPSTTCVLDRINVALMNTHRAMYANQIYSAQQHWSWTLNGEIMDSQKLLDRMAPSRAEQHGTARRET